MVELDVTRSALHFYFIKGPCRGCGKQVHVFRRSCPECRVAYPTSRRALYWIYVGMMILGVPAIILYVMWAVLGLKV